eukprot:7000669-Prymnesium_polylepis.1
MAPLSAAGKAALVPELWARHGRHVLSQTLLVTVLADLFAGRGEAVTDLPWDVDRDDEEASEIEWTTAATSA